MKLYIRLGHTWQEGTANGKQHDAYPAIYGPFEDKNEAMADMAKRWPNDKEARCVLFEGVIVKVPPSPLERPEAEKRRDAGGRRLAGVSVSLVGHVLLLDQPSMPRAHTPRPPPQIIARTSFLL